MKEVVKGGLIAEMEGGVRAFIPASHVSTKYVENLSEYVGKTVNVKVLEIDKQRKRIVASIKQVLLEEAAAREQAKWDSLVVGSKVHGIVRRITDFGAFVDIGGLDGLVHVTDAAWGRVKHPSDVLSVNQEVEVLILGVDKEKKRISLGYKQLQPKPWTMAGEKYPGVLPTRLLDAVFDQARIQPWAPASSFTKEQRQALVSALKGMPLTVKGARPFSEAVITRGGVSVKEVKPSTLESKLVPGLYLAGEILDVDAFTGGFNLQIAWSTGALAGGSV